ncbi:MAG: tRNA (N6-isopentenyl adenosine(37)-C2)-methylthiotransferase MiaB [Desulfovibrionaceae bacterium]
MKFSIVTFGCQMNANDSDWLARAMLARGWREVPEEQADVVVLNTCSVREKPEQKVHSALGRVGMNFRGRPAAFAAVGGCVAQQLGQELLHRYPFVRLVFGTDGVAQAPNALERLAVEPELELALLDILSEYPEREDAWTEHEDAPGPRQCFVNIMQGCDNFCAYCIVPYTRGRQKSRHPEAVLRECREQIARGAREITLLGQNVNSYGQDPGGAGMGFAELLRNVAVLPGLDRLRFTTSHPKDIAPEVIRAFGELKTLCPHLHLPLQSGSDRMLKRMGRKYDRTRYLDIVNELRSARPDIALGTDLIVGFPGETEQDFEETLEVMRLVCYEASFSFKYSDRPGVAAVNMRPKVEPDIAAERLSRLQELQNEITSDALQNRVGTVVEVLFERLSKVQSGEAPYWRGRDSAGRIVNVPEHDGRNLAGMIMPVRIVEAKKHSLIGEKAGDAW